MSTEQKLKINMLGEFSIAYGDRIINDQTNRSKKLWTLLEYLITFKNREISQSELIELLWPEDDITNPLNTLKTLLHRVRAMVGELGFEDTKRVITYRRGAYAWNCEIPCEVDTEQFEEHCRLAYAPDCTTDASLSHLLAAIDIYKGDFLPKNALDLWVVPINTYYRSMFIKVVREACDILKEQGRNDDVVKICQKAVVIDPYDEDLHLHLIKALVASGHRQQALSHYEYVTDLFFTKFAINVSPELTALYKEVVKTSKSAELDLRIIRDNLKEDESCKGAFFCEYEFFKDVYQIEARSASRTGSSIFLALITLSDLPGEKLSQKLLNKNMDRLKEAISGSLRRGDVFTRYSVSQYLVMLPTTTYENAEMVVRRIKRRFKSDNPKARVTLQHSLQPLKPIEI